MAYTTFEHTADVGIEATGADLPEVFAESARGLMALLVEDPGTVEVDETHTVELTAEEDDVLLFDWLSELLYLFSVGGLVTRRCEIQVTSGRLVARVEGGRFDPDHHRGRFEVKAITYHELALEPTDSGWRGRFIVDI